MIAKILAGLALCLSLVLAGKAGGQSGLTALALVDPARSNVEVRGGGLDLDLTLSQPVPYRVHTLADPPRLVLDFREVDFATLPEGALQAPARVAGVRHGRVDQGWTRLVLELTGAYGVKKAGMVTGAADGSVRVEVRLRAMPEDEFLRRSGAPASAIFATERPSLDPPPPRPEGSPMRVVLDPGHGGIDPGAVRAGVEEADLMLMFGRELRDALRRAGGFEVTMTRDEDVFVSLEERIARARRVGADVFLSLHADAIAEGIARGAQVYTLSEEASSLATQQLAERHDRDDLLAGVDLSGQDDRIAGVLMSIARAETMPRTDALANAMVDGLRGAGVRMHRRARESAAFSVLKAPDVPALLLEVGFMSSPGELEKLQSQEWRAKAVSGIVTALQTWQADDAARAALKRQ